MFELVSFQGQFTVENGQIPTIHESELLELRVLGFIRVRKQMKGDNICILTFWFNEFPLDRSGYIVLVDILIRLVHEYPRSIWVYSTHAEFPGDLLRENEVTPFQLALWLQERQDVAYIKNELLKNTSKEKSVLPCAFWAVVFQLQELEKFTRQHAIKMLVDEGWYPDTAVAVVNAITQSDYCVMLNRDENGEWEWKIKTNF